MTLIQKLKNKVNNESISKIAKKLGYRSQSTVYMWLQKGKIPNTAKLKVELFLEKEKRNAKIKKRH